MGESYKGVRKGKYGGKNGLGWIEPPPSTSGPYTSHPEQHAKLSKGVVLRDRNLEVSFSTPTGCGKAEGGQKHIEIQKSKSENCMDQTGRKTPSRQESWGGDK